MLLTLQASRLPSLLQEGDVMSDEKQPISPREIDFMICPSSIDFTPRTSPETFTNWARALSFTASTAFRPKSRGEIVEIIRQAESKGQ